MNLSRACWSLLFLWPATAAAQVVTVPQPLGRAAVACASSTPECETVPRTLSRHLAVRGSSTLHRYAWEVLQTLSKDPAPALRALGDVKRNYYRFIWLDDEYNDGEPVIRTLLVHLNDIPESAPSLPGLRSSSGPELIDIFASDDPGAILQTQYFSTRLEDPLRKQAPEFVQASGVVGFVSGALGRARGLAAGPPETTYSIARATLPLRRASVTIRDTVVIPGSAVELREAAAALRERLLLRDARSSHCAQTLAASHAAAITAGVAAGSCAAQPNQPAALNARQAAACRDELVDRLEESYKTTVAACQETTSTTGGDPLIAVDTKFTELVESLRQTRRTSESDLLNIPRTRFTFGLLSGAMLGAPTDFGSTVRVRVGDDGTIVQDPLPTTINMAVVNLHPRSYEEEQPSIRWSERFRFIAGTVVSPDFGVGGGAGVMIMRGLAVNAGWAMLFISSPKEGLAVGDTAPAGPDPLQTGRSGVFFAGLSYSFR